MDIPTVKNCKLALQTLNLLQYPRERIALVVNRPLGRADLREGDIARTLDMPISAVIPLDKEIATAVNRGVPVTVSASRSPAAKAMRELAQQLLPPVSGAEAKAAGKAAGADAKAQKRSMRKLPSPGRQSVLKAGMSRFSKSKDKKAA
jgi:pilus assembly protein CpaE